MTGRTGADVLTFMVASFGLHDGYQLPRVPLERVIESRARLDATMIKRIGGLVDGAVTELKWCNRVCHLAMHSPYLWINGSRVLVVWTDWALPWFECPRCGRRRRHIFLDELACRICLRLDYASRHRHRQMPGVHRVARLRRKLGADPRPFTAIPERPKHHVRYNRIAERIRTEEAGLVGYLGTIVHDLRRRIRIRKVKHQW